MITRTTDNRLLNHVRSNKDRAPYVTFLARLHEAVINDIHEILETYWPKEVSDALIVLDRLASLEELANRDGGV